ncbi:methylisocitrate lyase [Faunimonas sp. B44]|uniref:methylisocitrate lyase n=1 Tax=Faunimonas sp. B44 TaxID=3461493 RepID=UPI004044549E
MTVEWLEGPPNTPNRRGKRLRGLIASDRTLAVAGAYDGISALLAKNAGFEALYLSGAALSASKALPDLGLLTAEDVTRAARDMVRASDLPVIVDCDTGFGEALNVMRAVRELEEVGVACIQIEDQQFPKKCGHLNDKRIVPAEDMCRKIAAARRASSGMVICARTDAGADSLDEAIRRAGLYMEAGADLIFVEALRTEEDIVTVRRECRAPLLANMTEFGRTPQISVSEWRRFGYEVVIFPVSAFRVAARAMRDFYVTLNEKGDVAEHLPRMMSRAELYDTIQYYDYETLDEQIVRTVLEH